MIVKRHLGLLLAISLLAFSTPGLAQLESWELRVEIADRGGFVSTLD
jgi:hypothetical protein